MNANQIPCDILFRPADEIYSESIRQFQGCPTIAVTADGRIYLGWYSGGNTEPHMDNYNLLIYSDDDGGKTVTHHYGAKKIGTHFDEGMAYQRTDGSIRLLARTWEGALAESISKDDGLTWSEASLSDIVSADTRFYIGRTPSGRLLLVKNDHPKIRTNMTILLSEDDGITWKYSRCIDTRNDISYPDVDFHNGRIYLTYDRERTGAREILFLSFTEDDIMDESIPLMPSIISKPK